MKTTGRIIIALCMALGMVLSAAVGCAESADRPKIILYTAYCQTGGWDDVVQIGCVDEKGGLWQAEGSNADLKWPYKAEEQLAWLAQSPLLVQTGKLDSGELFDLKGLVAGAEDRGTETAGAADDAGTEYSWAVKRGRDGGSEYVLLGASGDELFENTDPDAQALYLKLRQLFPHVTSYAGEKGMGPQGFVPVLFRAFCGWPDADPDGAAVEALEIDCEAGPMAREVTEKEREEILRLVKEGRVTGKANATGVTGGTTAYVVRLKDGTTVSFEIYEGLLAWTDGMYFLSW